MKGNDEAKIVEFIPHIAKLEVESLGGIRLYLDLLAQLTHQGPGFNYNKGHIMNNVFISFLATIHIACDINQRNHSSHIDSTKIPLDEQPILTATDYSLITAQTAVGPPTRAKDPRTIFIHRQRFSSSTTFSLLAFSISSLLAEIAFNRLLVAIITSPVQGIWDMVAAAAATQIAR